MTDMPTTGKASVDVEASAEAAWALLADVTRMGEFSPECTRVEWTSGDSLAIGSRFRGFNKHARGYEWDAECGIVECEDGRSFTYEVPPGFEHATRWTFSVESSDVGCRVTESFEAPMLARPDVYPGVIEGRCEQLQAGIEATTARIKAALES